MNIYSQYGGSSVETKRTPGHIVACSCTCHHWPTVLINRKTGKTRIKTSGGREEGKIGGKPVNGVKNVHVGSIQAGRKNEYAECLGCDNVKKELPKFLL